MPDENLNLPQIKRGQEQRDRIQGSQTNPEIYFLLMFYSNKPIERDDEITIIKLLDKIKLTNKTKPHIILALNSTGGNIYPACKIIDITRTKCSKLTIVVPYWAKSAATLMCLGSDEIVMGAQSELGPLDMPFEHPHLEGQRVSAYDVVKALEYLQNLAIQKMVDDIGVKIRSKVGLSRKESIEIASKMAVDLITPILGKEDPRVIYKCFRMLFISGKYGMEFLRKYMLKDAPDFIRMKIKDIIYELVWEYPDHSFAIRREEAAKRLYLNIIKAENFNRWDDLWLSYLYFRPKGEKVIKLFSEEEFNNFVSILKKK